MNDSTEFLQLFDGAVGADHRPGATGKQYRVMPERDSNSSVIDLALVWRELTSGMTVVTGTYFNDAHCGLRLAPCQRSTGPLTGRRLQIIQSVLCGLSQNCIAIDAELAPSTVALNAREALKSLGVSCRPSRAHPLLMLMATAECRHLTVLGSLRFIESELGQQRVVQIPRPGQRLAEMVPHAELDVVARLVEGWSYETIAQQRGTAQRTIANQITGAFRRFNVSGRSELLQHLFELDGLIPPAAAAPPCISGLRH